MKSIILTNPSQVDEYIDTIQSFADSNRKAFGFLPKTTYSEQASRGHLWIAIGQEDQRCLGYLLFGGRYPTFRITQLFVAKGFRKHGIGSKLLSEFESYAEKNNFLTINARVAADLPANNFWEKAGYQLLKQVRGGKTTDRMINLRTKELNTPSLFHGLEINACVEKSGLKSLKTSQRPIFSSPTYVIDLNIFFDVVKDRVNRTQANRLISAGLNNEIKIYVTPEFCFELKKHKKGNQDPILEFAENLPTLPSINDDTINKLIGELKAIVFPERNNADQRLSRNRSDLTHLAYCVHHGASGFITREKAILSVSDQLKESYHIEVLSAADLIPSPIDEPIKSQSLSVNFDKESLALSLFKEDQRETIEKFLMTFWADKDFILDVLHPGKSESPRQRFVAWLGNKIIGFASWDNPHSLSHERVLHLYIDESFAEAEMIIDHVIEVVLRDSALLFPLMITLYVGPEQSITRSTALRRGFLPTHGNVEGNQKKELIKVVFNGPINKGNWPSIRENIKKFTGFHLPIRIPTHSEFINTGVIIKTKDGNRSCLSLFDFETLVSPGIICCPGRSALLVPIRLQYAQNFFVLPHTQRDLFFTPEALLHIEKAYFRSYRNASIFKRGGLVIFYISGSGGGFKVAIGCGRITYSEVIAVDKATLLLNRQGVLSRNELLKIANKDGMVHAFTFDNFSRFKNRITFSQLKSHKLISGANLVTAESLSTKNFVKICEMGFGDGEKNYD
ncbi:MAG: GNAT family N-acetyltransferase [Desulfobacteraceae bacterium]|jgi:GNAT superfamily N-acetyltransferase